MSNDFYRDPEGAGVEKTSSVIIVWVYSTARRLSTGLRCFVFDRQANKHKHIGLGVACVKTLKIDYLSKNAKW